MDAKILVVFARELREQIGNPLASLPVKAYFAETLKELTKLVRSGNTFQVAIFPADLPNAEVTCWELYGELLLMSIRPELLIYAREFNFQLWSSVLDAGGYDVLTEPFSPKELQSAVLLALENFQKRADLSQSGLKQQQTN